MNGPTKLKTQKEKEAMEKKIREDEIRTEIADRKAKQKKIYAASAPFLEGEGGVMGKLNHLIGLQKEAVIAELIMTIIINLFQLLIGFHYLKQKQEYAQAQELGIAYDKNDPNIIIYKTTEEGHLQPYLPGEDIPRADIRANGYVPTPSWVESVKLQWDEYFADIHGAQALSPERRERLYKTYELERERGKEKDLAWDSLAMGRGRPPAPKPKP